MNELEFSSPEDMRAEIKKLRGEKERLEQKVKELESMENLILLSPYGVFVIDQNGKYIYVNPPGVRDTGFSLEQLLDMTILDIVPENSKELVISKFNELQERGNVFFETPYFKKGGEEIGVWTVNAVKIEETQNYVGFTQDITKWKATQNELIRSEERFKSLSEQNLLAIAIVTENGLEYFNKAYVELTRYSEEELRAMTLEDTVKLIHPKDRRFVLEQGIKKIKGEQKGVVQNYEYDGLRKDGKIRRVRQFSKTIPWKGGYADLMTLIDVTREKRAIDITIQNHRINAIATAVQEIEHDIRNGLQGVKGNILAALEEDFVPTVIRKWLENADRAVDSATKRMEFLRRVGNKSKEENLEKKLVNINEIVSEIIESTRVSWQNKAERAGVKYEVIPYLSENLPPIECFKGDIEAATGNLFINSLQASPKGGRITFETGISPENGFVFLRIKDEGEGMSDDVKVKIFEPFFSTKSNSDLDPEGNRGLGLSGTYQTVTSLGGRIFVYSTSQDPIHHGTTIQMEFPPSEKLFLTEENNIKRNNETFKIDETNLNIIFVEDDNDLRIPLEAVLRSFGHRVEGFEKGNQSLEFLRTNYKRGERYLLLTDLSMKEMNGIELIRRVREQGYQMPVTILSGWGDVDSIIEECSPDFVLSKPAKKEDLQQMLRKANQMYNEGEFEVKF